MVRSKKTERTLRALRMMTYYTEEWGVDGGRAGIGRRVQEN